MKPDFHRYMRTFLFACPHVYIRLLRQSRNVIESVPVVVFELEHIGAINNGENLGMR